MQVFLPYANFAQCAAVLDRQRLGKQRVECKQILTACEYNSKGWVNHPVVKMWRGYEFNLCEYAIAVCHEWVLRGYNDTLCDYFRQESSRFQSRSPMPFLGNETMHSEYRRLLYTKQPDHYQQYFGQLEPLVTISYERYLCQ